MATAFHELSKHAVQRTMARYFQLAKYVELTLNIDFLPYLLDSALLSEQHVS